MGGWFNVLQVISISVRVLTFLKSIPHLGMLRVSITVTPGVGFTVLLSTFVLYHYSYSSYILWIYCYRLSVPCVAIFYYKNCEFSVKVYFNCNNVPWREGFLTVLHHHEWQDTPVLFPCSPQTPVNNRLREPGNKASILHVHAATHNWIWSCN